MAFDKPDRVVIEIKICECTSNECHQRIHYFIDTDNEKPKESILETIVLDLDHLSESDVGS